MRILVVQESDWMEVGPHQSHHLMERLSRQGHEIRVIDFEIRWKIHENAPLVSRRQVIDNYYKVFEDGGVTVIRPGIIHVPILDYVSLLFSHKGEIKRQIQEFKPDAIVGFGILNAHTAIHHANKYEIPFFYYIIDELHRLLPERHLQKIARFVESGNMKKSDMVISINEGLRDYTVQMGADPKKTTVIRAGVDLDAYNTRDRNIIRDKYGIQDDETVLFFMGWLYNFSGLKEVVLDLSRNRDRKIRLMILGKGDLWDPLQEIRISNGLEDKIIMESWVPFSEVSKYIIASDICILPAQKSEIMMNIVPIKMYEYMAAGKPVIATRLPGLMKEFGEGNGIVYVRESKEVLKAGIELIQSNRLKTEGEKAKKFVSSLDWDKLTSNFYEFLLKGKK